MDKINSIPRMENHDEMLFTDFEHDNISEDEGWRSFWVAPTIGGLSAVLLAVGFVNYEV